MFFVCITKNTLFNRNVSPFTKMFVLLAIVGCAAFGNPAYAENQEPLDPSTWTLDSSDNQGALSKAVNSELSSRWTSLKKQQGDEFFIIDLAKTETLSHLQMVTAHRNQGTFDYPRDLQVHLSLDGQNWELLKQVNGDQSGTTMISLDDREARYIKLEQTGNDSFYWWSIHDLAVYASSGNLKGNQGPVSEFVAPTPENNSSIALGHAIDIELSAVDVDGDVANVKLFLNDELVRQENVSPYEWNSTRDAKLSNLIPGNYKLRAEATDNLGTVTSVITNFLLEGEPNSNNAVDHLYPKNDGPQINPLKGWNSSWWKDLPESSVGFQYIAWNEFEPKDNEFDFSAVEDIIDRDGSRNRHVVLRLFCDWYGDDVKSRGCPDWMYSEVGVKRLRGQNGRYITDYNDPNYLSQAERAIEELGKRFDNDPRVYGFQLGVIGYWGEWHTFGSEFDGDSYEITETTQRRILNAYQNAFSRSKLFARYPYRDLMQSTTNIGFHNDFFRPNNGHSAEFDEAVDSGERWKDGPIGGEAPPGLSADDLDALYGSSQGREMIEKGHYSTMAPPEVPDQHRNDYLKLHKRFGYNYQIEKAVFPDRLPRFEELRVSFEVKNIGIAPMYYDWHMQFALLDDNNNVVAQKSHEALTLSELMPGANRIVESNLATQEVEEGAYRLAVRLIQPNAGSAKADQWKLNARNTYIEFANAIPVEPGSWGDKNQLVGGWSILGDVVID